jgi:parvulin-like peptidyl-prolyl isomerase
MKKTLIAAVLAVTCVGFASAQENSEDTVVVGNNRVSIEVDRDAVERFVEDV